MTSRKQHPLYYTYKGMHSRCANPLAANYRFYGGRGIKVCDRWNSFDCFLADMGDRPVGTSLDRIDGNGHYEPSNCRWATVAEQNANKRDCRLVTINGITLHLAEWSRRSGISKGTLQTRIDSGWPNERLLSEPLAKHRSRPKP